MQMFTDFMKALSRIFRMVDHSVATSEKLLNQVAYNLDAAEAEAKYKAIAARRTAKTTLSITDDEEKNFDESFWK